MQAQGVGSSGLFGGAERLNEKLNAPKDGSKLGKDAFLKLLVTQMEHQDPLNPVADTDFIAQLSQYSSLEHLMNISKSVEGLNTRANSSILSTVDFIGKNVMSRSDSLSKNGDKISKAGYTLTEDSVKVMANVFDDKGNIVRSVELPARNADSYVFEWDGKDFNGNETPDGNYHLAIGAVNRHGRPVMVDIQVAGTVRGVKTVDGMTMLQLTDGRELKADTVTQVVGQ